MMSDIRAHAPRGGGHAGARHPVPGETIRIHERPLATVSAVPPSRSDEPMTPGRSSDFQTSSAACLLARPRRIAAPQWPEAADLVAWSQRRGRPGFTPEFPVCRPHERSRSQPPESLAECTGEARAVKQIEDPRRRPQGFTLRGRSGGNPCRLHLTLTRNPDGFAGARGTLCAAGMRCILNATATRKCLWAKNFGTVQAERRRPPIALVSPGASLCPSGNQGAAITCDQSSHGMARQACRGEFVNHNLGVTPSQAGRPHR